MHLTWFLQFEIGLGIICPLFVVYFIAQLPIKEIDQLVEPRDLYLIFAALLCGHIAEMAEKRRQFRLALAMMLIIVGITSGAGIRAAELSHFPLQGAINTWPLAIVYATMVVVMIMSTIALKEDSEGEEIQKGSEEEQGSKTLSAGPDPKAQEKGQE